MNVILCHPGDVSAVWLAHALRSCGVALEVASVEALVYSRRIAFRQDSAGDRGSVTLHDGRVLRPEAIGVLVNRVRYLPTAHFATAAPGERAYAESELDALLLAWLNTVPGRVVNPPHPGAPGGAALAAMTMCRAALRAGLPAPPWQASSETTQARIPATGATQASAASHVVIAFDGRLYGSRLPHPLQDGVRRLASLLDLPLLQVGFDRGPRGAWRFVDATGDVDFRRGGDAFARDLAAVMSPRPAA